MTLKCQLEFTSSHFKPLDSKMVWVIWAFVSLLVSPVFSQGFYQNSDVIELTPESFDDVVLGTNYTTVVEFYAPWCGHCNKFKGPYRKAAKILKDIVNVAAVNCDLDVNKPLCGRYRIEGFPTVKVFRPPKYLEKRPPKSKKAVRAEFADETYSGERSSNALVAFSQTRIKSYVRRIFDMGLFDKFLQGSKPKVILISDSKPKPSVFLKSLAIDYLGVADFAYFDFKGDFKEQSIISKIGLQEVPKKPFFLVFGEESKDFKIIQDELSKDNIAQFLSENYGVSPAEGPGSDRYKIIKGLRKGKPYRELSKKSKKTAKTDKKVKGKRTRDEL